MSKTTNETVTDDGWPSEVGSTTNSGWTIETQSSWEAPPEGVFPAVVEKVSEPWEEVDTFSDSGKMKTKFSITYKLTDQTGSDGGPLSISRKYTASMYSRSNLSKDVAAIVGTLTPEQSRSFQPQTLEGKACQVIIEHTPRNSGDGVWANVARVVKAA